jgi:hypothetical protein
MTDFQSLIEDVMGYMERDEYGNYFVNVYDKNLGMYEWMPVTEEMAEILALLEDHLHGEDRRRKKSKNSNRKQIQWSED